MISVVLAEGVDTCTRHLGVSIYVLLPWLEFLSEATISHELLERLNVHYHAPGDARNTGLESNSVEVDFSYGTLEHIPEEDLACISRESARILREDGRSYHNIGTHDHFHGAGVGNDVNFLRNSKWRWHLIAGNRFAYHNRLRVSDYLRIIGDNGLKVTYLDRELTRENLQALDKLKIHAKFANLTPEGSCHVSAFRRLGHGAVVAWS